MKCKKQSPYLRKAGIHIDNVWEVQIPQDTWQRIQRVASDRRLTYSWVTRYCVFRLVRRKRLRFAPAMEKLSACEQQMYRDAEIRHRHQMCLYGGDEKLLRMTAMHLEMTVSRLIRLALLWFLPRLECRSKLAAWRRSGLYYQSQAEVAACSAPPKVKLRRWQARMRRTLGFSIARDICGDDLFWFGIKLVKSTRLGQSLRAGRPFRHTWRSQHYQSGEWFGRRACL